MRSEPTGDGSHQLPWFPQVESVISIEQLALLVRPQGRQIGKAESGVTPSARAVEPPTPRIGIFDPARCTYAFLRRLL